MVAKRCRAYLNKVNQGLEEKDWKVTCLLFATNAPDQNPVEDVWLQALVHKYPLGGLSS